MVGAPPPLPWRLYLTLPSGIAFAAHLRSFWFTRPLDKCCLSSPNPEGVVPLQVGMSLPAISPGLWQGTGCVCSQWEQVAIPIPVFSSSGLSLSIGMSSPAVTLRQGAAFYFLVTSPTGVPSVTAVVVSLSFCSTGKISGSGASFTWDILVDSRIGFLHQALSPVTSPLKVFGCLAGHPVSTSWPDFWSLAFPGTPVSSPNLISFMSNNWSCPQVW